MGTSEVAANTTSRCSQGTATSAGDRTFPSEYLSDYRMTGGTPRPPFGIAPSPAPAWGCIKTASQWHRTAPLPDVPGTGIPHSRRPAPRRRRRLYLHFGLSFKGISQIDHSPYLRNCNLAICRSTHTAWLLSKHNRLRHSGGPTEKQSRWNPPSTPRPPSCGGAPGRRTAGAGPVAIEAVMKVTKWLKHSGIEYYLG
jgi:hypothetical protein